MDTKFLLDSAKNAVLKAGKEVFLADPKSKSREYFFDSDIPKEIKASADTFIEEKIIHSLKPLGISILSEESGFIDLDENSDSLFILDPLDGTYNFVKGSGPCCISLALWKKNKPIFGIIYDLNTSKITWGGKKIGSFLENEQISVSDEDSPSSSVIASGFPVRFTPDKKELKDFHLFLDNFAKVRMIGSAAMSLNLVSQGFFDAYFERNIMLWDVAAGLAIVEGAGGKYKIFQKDDKYLLDVFVTNKPLMEKIII